MDQLLAPFSSWSGPRQPRILAIGEAWGGNEAELRRPFVGEAGKEFWRMLGDAWPQVAPELHREIEGLHRFGLAWVRRREEWLAEAGLAMTNVFNLQPPGNKLEELCCGKTELPDRGRGYEFPALVRGKYLRPEFLPQLHRLHLEILESRPLVVLALGNTACWATLRATNIGSIRGTTTLCQGLVGSSGEPATIQIKCVPTYHPAGVLRQWSWRPIVVADLMKTWREAEAGPELHRPEREVLINPTLEDLRQWTSDTLNGWRSEERFQILSVDIETTGGLIKCIGFARSAVEAIVVPFCGEHEGSYWPDKSSESAAWECVRRLLCSGIPKLGQNFLYDLQYLLRMGFRVENCVHDTMLLHHSLFPELQKGLGFLGSIYTNEASWKLMRRAKPDTEKRDE